MLDWFTTIPGILIICGVVLLIIAIILFIIGAKKFKTDETVITDSLNNSSNAVPTMEKVGLVTPVEPVTVEAMGPSFDNNFNKEETVQTNQVEQESVTIEEPVIQEPVIEMPTVNTNRFEVPVVDTTTSSPVVDNNIPEIPVVNSNNFDVPVVDSNNSTTYGVEAPVVDNTTNSSLEVNNNNFEVPVVDSNNSTIYGGEAPIVDFSVNQEKPVTIYGGNDPLEATQSLPKMEEHHAPYGGIYPEVKIADSTQSVEVPTPVDEVVSSIPTIEPIFDISDEEPVIQNTPAVEENFESPTPIIIPVDEQKTTVEEL